VRRKKASLLPILFSNLGFDRHRPGPGRNAFDKLAGPDV